MIEIAICDDEPFFVQKIHSLALAYFTQHKLAVNCTCFTSGTDFLEHKKLASYDIVFLDVDLGEMNGIMLAKKLREYNPHAVLIYVSAFLEFAHLGYETKALGYLLKESLDLDFPHTMKQALKELHWQQDCVEIKMTSHTLTVPLRSIYYLESVKRQVVFHCANAPCTELQTYEKLDTYEVMLHKKGFVRIHQSFLVNMEQIQSMEKNKVILKTGEQLIASKALYFKAFQQLLLWRGAHGWNI